MHSRPDRAHEAGAPPNDPQLTDLPEHRLPRRGLRNALLRNTALGNTALGKTALGALALTLALFAAACGSSTSTTVAADTEAGSSDDAMSDDDMSEMADDAAMEDMDGDHSDDHSDGDHSDGDHSNGDHGDGDHHHGEPLEVAADLPTPSLTLEAFEDPKSGWNIHAVPTNHTIAAMSASTPHVDGEGHMHLYVDGERVGRIYNEWVHLGALSPGEHEIRVELSANSHAPLAIDGVIIDQTVTITQPEPSDAAGHAHGMTMDVSALDPAPTVTLEVFEDPKTGWNVHAVATNHVLNPEAASTEHVAGEGHMHLYVDGKKVTRLYGEWYHLGGLSNGDHDIRVELSANSHAALAIGDTIIDQTVTITETRSDAMADDAHDAHGDDDHSDEHASDGHDDEHAGDEHDSEAADGHDHGHAHEATADGSDLLGDADSTITLAVDGDTISGDTGRQVVEFGSTVGIVVSSNVADEVHLHGYDLLRPVGPGTDAVIVFEADIPGLFEVELEGAGELLFELQVS